MPLRVPVLPGMAVVYSGRVLDESGFIATVTKPVPAGYAYGVILR